MAAFALSFGTWQAGAQDLSSVVSGVYGKKSAIYTGDSRTTKASSASGGNVYRAFMYGKGSYEARMARWGNHCLHVGDGEAMLGSALNAFTFKLPVLSFPGDMATRYGNQKEGKCSNWREAFMTRYEREERARENQALLDGIEERVANGELSEEFAEALLEEMIDRLDKRMEARFGVVRKDDVDQPDASDIFTNEHLGGNPDRYHWKKKWPLSSEPEPQPGPGSDAPVSQKAAPTPAVKEPTATPIPQPPAEELDRLPAFLPGEQWALVPPKPVPAQPPKKGQAKEVCLNCSK